MQPQAHAETASHRVNDEVAHLIRPPYRRYLTEAIDPDDPDIAAWRRALDTEGCALIRGFLDPAALARAERECASIAHLAYSSERYTNCYDSYDDPSLPADHPTRLFMKRTQAFVAKDQIPEQFVVHALYKEAGFRRLVAACLGEEVIYEYADPFGALVVNVLEPGTTHPWHYDATEFVISMMTRQPEGGGIFEYCPQIRSRGDENIEAVSGVIRETDRSPVKELDLRPGDLQLFKGRYSLHRVTPVEGDRSRHTVIFSYAKEPGVVGKSKRAKTLFGRVADVHVQADGKTRDDELTD